MHHSAADQLFITAARAGKDVKTEPLQRHGKHDPPKVTLKWDKHTPLAPHSASAPIVRVHGHRHVTQHRLEPGRGHNHLASAVRHACTVAMGGKIASKSISTPCGPAMMPLGASNIIPRAHTPPRLLGGRRTAEEHPSSLALRARMGWQERKAERNQCRRSTDLCSDLPPVTFGICTAVGPESSSTSTWCRHPERHVPFMTTQANNANATNTHLDVGDHRAEKRAPVHWPQTPVEWRCDNGGGAVTRVMPHVTITMPRSHPLLACQHLVSEPKCTRVVFVCRSAFHHMHLRRTHLAKSPRRCSVMKALLTAVE